jgi:hypothetical protein
VTLRQIDDDAELRHIRQRGVGLIYNDFSGTGPTGGAYNVLHGAGCSSLGRSNTNVRKWYFDDVRQAVIWLEANRGPEGKKWKRCGICTASK